MGSSGGRDPDTGFAYAVRTYGQPTKEAEVHEFDTGAVRSTDVDGARYDLISPIGMRRLAETCKEGADKYSDYNWEKGMPVSAMLQHAMGHIMQYLAGDRSEDHLAHGCWNLMGAMHSEELWPHLNKNLRRAGCVPPNVTDDEAARWREPTEEA